MQSIVTVFSFDILTFYLIIIIPITFPTMPMTCEVLLSYFINEQREAQRGEMTC